MSAFQNFIADDLDFVAYMDTTEHDQKIIAAGDYAEDVVAYFWDEKRERGHSLPWEKAKGKLAFRPGEVTLWAGYNGHGKSLALGQFCVGLIPQLRRMCIASLEMKPVVTLARMCRQACGSSKPDPEYIRMFHDLLNKCVWMYDQQGTVSWEKMIGVIQYAAKVKQCEHFILDSLLKCGIGEDDYTKQKMFVDALCSVARDTGIHIHFVAHSRKAQNEHNPPGKMDVKGTGSITDQVDNVVTWWRNKAKEEAIRTGKTTHDTEPDAMLICDKQRNGEWEGKLGFWFEPGSLQFVESPNAVPYDLMGGA